MKVQKFMWAFVVNLSTRHLYESAPYIEYVIGRLFLMDNTMRYAMLGGIGTR